MGRGSSGDDFGDEDTRVVAHVRVVCSSCYAEAEARVPLQNRTRTVRDQDEVINMINVIALSTHSLQRDLLILDLSFSPVHLQGAPSQLINIIVNTK